MKGVTEQQILAMAPNSAAAANGKKIAKSGFVRLEKSADDTLFLGECVGSGKSNYITTVDFINPSAPLCRCSCPSRQFPCKHGLALLYVIMEDRSFGLCEIPEDIARKRAKLAGKAAGGDVAKETATVSEEQAEKKKAAAAKNAKAKKLRMQLEGLELTKQLLAELLKNGLGTMGGTSLKNYEQLAKQLGDYYLPGPQRLLNGLILEISAYQKDGSEVHYEAAIDILERLGYLVKKAKEYLSAKLENGEVAADDNMLYEELGGIWKLSELTELGRGMGDVRLAQLAFWVKYNEAAKQYEDIGCYVDLASGEIYLAKNYRPLKALKYIKAEDTIFGVVHTENAATYPGVGNLRVRWDGAQIDAVQTQDLTRIREHAKDQLAACVKNAKTVLMHPLADGTYISLVSFSEIGRIGGQYVLKNAAGETIALGDAPGMEACTERLALLPDGGLLKDQTLLGAFFYDREEKRIKLMPLSIVTAKDIVRLLY